MNASLNLTDFAALSPLLLLLAGGLLLLLLESFAESFAKRHSMSVTLATLFLAIAAALYAPASENPLLTDWLNFDALSRFFTILFLAIGVGSVLLASQLFKQFETSQGEYFFLLLSCLFGLILIAAATDFLTLFLGFETLSLSLYILCGYMKKWEISHESAIKYFLMGSIASAFLLYGIALIYGAVGTTQFNSLLDDYRSLSENSEKALFLGGIALVTIGLAFKAAIVPFHVWAPDVYEGASTPVTAFMATATKAGAFAAFIRVFLQALPHFDLLWNEGLALLVYPTLIYANLMALRQVQMRRFFAYSGISHAGFLLIPLVAGSADALPALLFYLVVYIIATLGSFAVLSYLDQRKGGVILHDLYGLFRRSPFLAGIFSLCLLTLAGIPPTAGFFAKFYIFKVAFQSGYYDLVILGLLTTVISVFYYLRIVAVMLSKAPAEETFSGSYWPAAAIGVLSLAAILWLSIYPMPLLNLLAVASK